MKIIIDGAGSCTQLKAVPDLTRSYLVYFHHGRGGRSHGANHAVGPDIYRRLCFERASDDAIPTYRRKG